MKILCHQRHQGFIPECFRAKDFIKATYEHLVSLKKALDSTLIEKALKQDLL